MEALLLRFILLVPVLDETIEVVHDFSVLKDRKISGVMYVEIIQNSDQPPVFVEVPV